MIPCLLNKEKEKRVAETLDLRHYTLQLNCVFVAETAGAWIRNHKFAETKFCRYEKKNTPEHIERRA